MSPGLKIIQIRVSYYYCVTYVGWVRRVAGDEHVLLPGARLIQRSGSIEWSGLDQIAADGPNKRYKLHPPTREEIELHRLTVLPPRKCNAEAWRKECPCPVDWNER